MQPQPPSSSGLARDSKDVKASGPVAVHVGGSIVVDDVRPPGSEDVAEGSSQPCLLCIARLPDVKVDIASHDDRGPRRREPRKLLQHLALLPRREVQ